MILAFPAFRKGYFKVTGPVIDAALRRGHTPIFLWRDEPKPGEHVDCADLGQRWPSVMVAAPGSIVPDAPTDTLIGPQLESFGWPLTRWPRRVSLDYAWEQANAPGGRGDLIQCFASLYQLNLARQHWMEGVDPAVLRDSVWSNNTPITGSTTMDAFGLIDKTAVRRRYALQHSVCSAHRHPVAGCEPCATEVGKPVFLLFSPKLRVPHAWRRWVYRYLHFRALVWDLRRWCDTHGHTFVVKTRAKHGDPSFLAKYADRVIGDEDLWPHTSAQLLSVASLAMHFQSNASLEAAMAAVPQYSVRLPQPHLKGYRTTTEVYSGHSFTIGHWPRVIRLLDTVERMEPFVVDPVERSRYVDRYLGPSDDYKSAERVMDLVEARA